MEISKHFGAVKLCFAVLMVDSCVGVKLLVPSHVGPGSEIWLLSGGTLGSAAALLLESLANIWGVFWGNTESPRGA